MISNFLKYRVCVCITQSEKSRNGNKKNKIVGWISKNNERYRWTERHKNDNMSRLWGRESKREKKKRKYSSKYLLILYSLFVYETNPCFNKI